jgi:hypothetical protein
MNQVEDTVADLKGIPTREKLIELLRKEVVEVTFTKLDGDERVMPCTLIESFCPDPKKETTQKNDKVVAVWAIESKGFRSFRYDRVKTVKIIPYGNGGTEGNED